MTLRFVRLASLRYSAATNLQCYFPEAQNDFTRLVRLTVGRNVPLPSADRQKSSHRLATRDINDNCRRKPVVSNGLKMFHGLELHLPTLGERGARYESRQLC